MPALRALWLPRLVDAPIVVLVAGNGKRGGVTGSGARSGASLSEPMCISFCPRTDEVFVGNAAPDDSSSGFIASLSLVTGEMRHVPLPRATHFPGVAVSPNGEMLAFSTGKEGGVGICLRGTTVVSSALVAGATRGFADGKGAAAQFDWPAGVALSHSNGIVYVCDRNNFRIRECRLNSDDPLAEAEVTTLAGSGDPRCIDGVGKEASFLCPHSICLSNDGRQLIVGEDAAVRIIDIDSRRVRTLAGSGRQGYCDAIGPNARFSGVLGISIDAAGTIFATDAYNHRIRAVYPDGHACTVAGTGVGVTVVGPVRAASFRFPKGIVVTTNGSLLITEFMSSFVVGIPCAAVPEPSRYAFGSHVRFPREVRQRVATVLVLARSNADRIVRAAGSLSQLPMSLLAILLETVVYACFPTVRYTGFTRTHALLSSSSSADDDSGSDSSSVEIIPVDDA
eukprot:Amastigsp_a842199_34.p1 type:complete len:452 gc:universal Amastigsp_a842199_34:1475-120(-)